MNMVKCQRTHNVLTVATYTVKVREGTGHKACLSNSLQTHGQHSQIQGHIMRPWQTVTIATGVITGCLLDRGHTRGWRMRCFTSVQTPATYRCLSTAGRPSVVVDNTLLVLHLPGGFIPIFVTFLPVIVYRTVVLKLCVEWNYFVTICHFWY